MPHRGGSREWHTAIVHRRCDCGCCAEFSQDVLLPVISRQRGARRLHRRVPATSPHDEICVWPAMPTSGWWAVAVQPCCLVPCETAMRSSQQEGTNLLRFLEFNLAPDTTGRPNNIARPVAHIHHPAACKPSPSVLAHAILANSPVAALTLTFQSANAVDRRTFSPQHHPFDSHSIQPCLPDTSDDVGWARV